MTATTQPKMAEIEIDGDFTWKAAYSSDFKKTTKMHPDTIHTTLKYLNSQLIKLQNKSCHDGGLKIPAAKLE